MHKMEFGQAYCKDLLNSILMKGISYFSSFIVFSRYFRSLNEIENQKIGCTVSGRLSAHG
jgi:hypothetical protein